MSDAYSPDQLEERFLAKLPTQLLLSLITTEAQGQPTNWFYSTRQGWTYSSNIGYICRLSGLHPPYADYVLRNAQLSCDEWAETLPESAHPILERNRKHPATPFSYGPARITGLLDFPLALLLKQAHSQGGVQVLEMQG